MSWTVFPASIIFYLCWSGGQCALPCTSLGGNSDYCYFEEELLGTPFPLLQTLNDAWKVSSSRGDFIPCYTQSACSVYAVVESALIDAMLLVRKTVRLHCNEWTTDVSKWINLFPIRGKDLDLWERMCSIRHNGLQIGDAYGPGSGQIWLSNVSCVGNETDFTQCRHAGWGIHSCDHSDDVSISCFVEPSSQHTGEETIHLLPSAR